MAALAECARHRVLALVDAARDAEQYEQFFDDLREIGCEIKIGARGGRNIPLERFGERVFDTVLVMCERADSTEELIEFVDNGGNAVVFAGVRGSDALERMCRHLGLRAGAMITDTRGQRRVVLRKVIAPESVVRSTVAPLAYEGGFVVIERANEFRFPVVVGGLEHSAARQERGAVGQFAANDLVPVAALQGRTGGRIVVVPSHSFATDAMYGAPIELSEAMEELAEPVQNGNRELMRQLAEWVTHYKSHAKIVEARHYDEESGETPVQYRMRQNVTVDVRVQSAEEGEWKDYTGDDVQVEVFMLGVFVRRHMKLVEPGHYVETIEMPDRAGNYKIKVFTSRDGWMNAREEMAIAVRPLAIREKEKFLFCAEPYQLSMMLVMAAAFLAAVHFLYHKPSTTD